MLIFKSPAKLNLYLKVLCRREDGYHQIDTLFERIDLADHIFIELGTNEIVITCDDPNVPTDENSLLHNTVREFNKWSGQDLKVRIHVKKRIPVAAGLGGGSSNAATVLKGLNDLSEKPLKKEELIAIGRNLGSDIPFFINNYRFGVGRERGDKVEKVTTDMELWHILIKPPFPVATKDIYDSLSAFSLTKDIGIDKMVNAFLKGDNSRNLADNLCNDLQPIVLRKFPVLNEVISEIKKAGAMGVLLSGSGSTVFGIFDKDCVEEAKNKLSLIFPAEKDWEIYTAKTC